MNVGKLFLGGRPLIHIHETVSSFGDLTECWSSRPGSMASCRLQLAMKFFWKPRLLLSSVWPRGESDSHRITYRERFRVEIWNPHPADLWEDNACPSESYTLALHNSLLHRLVAGSRKECPLLFLYQVHVGLTNKLWIMESCSFRVLKSCHGPGRIWESFSGYSQSSFVFRLCRWGSLRSYIQLELSFQDLMSTLFLLCPAENEFLRD